MDCGRLPVTLGDPRQVDRVVGYRSATRVRFLFGGCRRQGIRGVRMFGEVDPASRWVNGAVLSSRFDTGRERKAGDGEAHQLALTAAEAADGIAHEQNLGEVVAAEGGTAEALARAELALDRDTVVGVCPEVRSAVLRRVWVLSFPAGALEFILEFHLQRLLFSGSGGRSKSFSGVLRGVLWLRGVRIG